MDNVLQLNFISNAFVHHVSTISVSPFHNFSVVNKTFKNVAPVATLTNLNSFATSDLKMQPLLFSSTFLFHDLYNTLTFFTFIPFSLSALFYVLTLLACCGEPGT